MEFSRATLQQGMKNQEASNETPDSFASIDGASVDRPTRSLDKGNQRMAGEVGARALQLMTNPDEAKRTGEWLGKFALSNQGAMFNQAKMNGGMPPPA